MTPRDTLVYQLELSRSLRDGDWLISGSYQLTEKSSGLTLNYEGESMLVGQLSSACCWRSLEILELGGPENSGTTVEAPFFERYDREKEKLEEEFLSVS